jgi:hypothetical protein
MKLWTWMIAAYVVAFLSVSAVALAQAVGDPVAATTMGDFLAGSGWGNGLWKGALLGFLRALFGYWSKKPDDAAETWDWLKFGSAGLVGAACGAVAGSQGLSYENAQGWAAQFGITEAVYRIMQGLWRKYGVKLGAEVAVRAMEIQARRLAKPPGA